MSFLSNTNSVPQLHRKIPDFNAISRYREPQISEYCWGLLVLPLPLADCILSDAGSPLFSLLYSGLISQSLQQLSTTTASGWWKATVTLGAHSVLDLATLPPPGTDD